MSFDPVATPSRPDSSIVESPPGYRDQTWDQAAGQPEYSVHLDHLPAGLIIPDSFPEPLRYDAAAKLLRYRGMMYHGSYSFLRGQSTALPYLMAVDALYQTSATPQPTWHPGRWIAALSAGVSAAALIFAWKLMH